MSDPKVAPYVSGQNTPVSLQSVSGLSSNPTARSSLPLAQNSAHEGFIRESPSGQLVDISNIESSFSQGVGDVFAPATGSFIASVPSEKVIYQINGCVIVNAHITSGSVLLNALWTDANGVERNTLVVGSTVSGTVFASGGINIQPLKDTAVTWEIVIGGSFIGGTPDVSFSASVTRISSGESA